MSNDATLDTPDDVASRLARAAAHWSALPTAPARTRWWESRLIMRHINVTYCGKPVEGTDGGDIELIRRLGNGRVFERAVSVGTGIVHHEIRLLQSGAVGHFEIFEISASRADQARVKADAAGVGDRMTIHVADAFAEPAVARFDLVYWKDALHHMFDAAAAVQWSRDVLLTGGLFFMNEFVGPTLMQYSDRQLDLAERTRTALPARYLDSPRAPGTQLPVRPGMRVGRPLRTDQQRAAPVQIASGQSLQRTARDAVALQ